MTEDTIRKTITINAPPERVWDAIGNANDFGAWFGCDFANATFEPGKTVTATITDPPEHAGTSFPVSVVDMDRPRLFSFRWHAYEPEPGADPATQPTTLIEFVLEPQGNGTRLTITESGFERIPADKRANAFRSNDEGWGIQAQRIRAYAEARK